MRAPALQRPAHIRDARRHCFAFVGYLCLTLVLLHPIASHFATRVPHDLGDPLLSTTLLWWNAHTPPLTARWWDGFFFAPGTGAVAFSDHRLGESLIASPLIWSGVAPIAAYNITLLLTFPLCAIAAHLLAWELTRRHDASILAGLAYGFSPYRFAHLEHLELLAAYGMPLALAALHRSLADPRPRWAIAFGAALLLQAVSCSYYLLFFLVLLALWASWFLRRTDIVAARNAAVALLGAALVIAPLAWSYRSIHEHYGFARGLNDIITLSADVTSYVTASPLVWLWGWTSSLNGPERQLMPGIAVTVLAATGAIASWRRRRRNGGRNHFALAVAALAVTFTGIAVFTAVHGPWQFAVGSVVVSARTVYKPLSLAAAAVLAAIASSSMTRDAYRRRSPFAFYLIAAFLLGLCSLGPAPSFMGHQFLYEPPYAWLMRVAVFGESIRVPSRFAMPAFLALAIAAAIACSRFAGARGRRSALVAVAAATIALEAWSKDIPMLDPPREWPSQLAHSGAAFVLDLPAGEVNHDVAAMYRAALAGLRSVNGYSGFQPPHYEALRLATSEHDETVLYELAERGRLLVGVDRSAPQSEEIIDWLQRLRLPVVFDDERASWFVVDKPKRSGQGGQQHCVAPPLGIAALRDRDGKAVALPRVTTLPQQRGDALIADLGRIALPCAVRFSLGTHAGLFPRLLTISTSPDGYQWRAVVNEKTGGRAVLAAVDNPRDPQLEFAIPAEAVRYVKLQLDADHATAGWAVTALSISGSPAE